jgi:hypothetical protein
VDEIARIRSGRQLLQSLNQKLRIQIFKSRQIRFKLDLASCTNPLACTGADIKNRIQIRILDIFMFSCTCRPFRNTKGKHSTANIHARVNHTAIANLLPAGWARVLPILKFVEPPRCLNRRGLLGLLVIMLAKAPPQPKNPRKHYSLSEYSQWVVLRLAPWLYLPGSKLLPSAADLQSARPCPPNPCVVRYMASSS